MMLLCIFIARTAATSQRPSCSRSSSGSAAVGGRGIAQELLATRNFVDFKMHRLEGPIAASKGMALFPRLIEGRYAMLGRHDNENIWLLLSDNLHHWDGGIRIVNPQ